MTRLFTCGYETGDVNEAGVSTIGTSLAVVNTAPTPRASGAYCLKAAIAGSSSFTATYKSFTFAALKTDVWVRFGFQPHAIGASAEVFICGFYDSAASIQTAVSYSGVDNLLRVYRGSGTLLATSSASVPLDAWRLIEVRWQATSITVGVVEVWLDGTRVINATAIDNTQTTVVGVQSVNLGVILSSNNNVASSTWFAFDDIAMNDTAGTANNGRCGDGRVILLLPTGAGSSAQWARGGTDTGANYSQVNEIPPSMAQYVGSPTVGNRDLYAMGDISVAVQSINCVEAVLLAMNSDAGGGSVGLTLKSGATVSEATPIALGASATYVTSRWETDPATSTAWTVAGVNALEAGATVR